MVPMSLHRYLYALGNPTVYVDLDGRCYGNAALILSPYECTLMTADALGVDPGTREGVRAIADHDLRQAKLQTTGLLTGGAAGAAVRASLAAGRVLAGAWRVGGWRLAAIEAAPTAAVATETATLVGLSAAGLGEAPPTPLSAPITSARRVISRLGGEGASAAPAAQTAHLYSDVPLLTHQPTNLRHMPVPVARTDQASLRIVEGADGQAHAVANADAATVTAAERSASFQGVAPYEGVDRLRNIRLDQGKRIAHVTFREDGRTISEYFTTESAIRRATLPDGSIDANRLNQGLQIYAGKDPVTGLQRPDFKPFVQFYETTGDIPMGQVAFGRTLANPPLNPGGYPALPQMFINKEYHQVLRPLELHGMANTTTPFYTWPQ